MTKSIIEELAHEFATQEIPEGFRHTDADAKQAFLTGAKAVLQVAERMETAGGVSGDAVVRLEDLRRLFERRGAA